jgi:aminoacyl-tRNA hydrolase
MARVRTLGSDGTLVLKPLTMMNLSGYAVFEVARYFRIALGDILVVADDVNLVLGRLRARPSGSAGGHNGFRSIIDQLGTTEFSRLRVGVGRGDPRPIGRPRALRPTPAAGGRDQRLRAPRMPASCSSPRIAPVMNRFNGPGDAREV